MSTGPYWGSAPGMPYMGQPGGSHFHHLQPTPYMMGRAPPPTHTKPVVAKVETSKILSEDKIGIEEKKPRHRKLGNKPSNTAVDKNMVKK